MSQKQLDVLDAMLRDAPLDLGGDVQQRGRYLELDPPDRLVIGWGGGGSSRLPPGASTLEIALTPEAGGTRVQIRHHHLPEPEASRHPAGWRHFLAQLTIIAAGGELRPPAGQPLPAHDNNPDGRTQGHDRRSTAPGNAARSRV